MIIKLYNNTSAPNYVSKNITLVSELTGTLREPTSITSPTITIERASPVGFNYAQIPDLNRYYYVSGVSTEAFGLISLSLKCDVLMSYAEQIRNMNAIIKRQENQFNLYLDDGIFKAYQNTKHKIIKFPYGFSQYSYILALAGNSDS